MTEIQPEMSTWYRLEIGKIEVAAPRLAEVRAAFMPPYLLTPAGSGRALFWRENDDTSATEVFFTAPAADVALALGAVPCEKPGIGAGRIRMLAGDDDLSTHFPGQEQA